MFITTKVFDPQLGGKAIHLAGYDVDGNLLEGFYLVKKVDGQNIKVINRTGVEETLNMENFEHKRGLKLQVLELPQPIEEVETLPVIRFVEPPKKKHKTGFKRKQGAKNYRSDLQIKVDNNHLEYLLQENIEPLKLEDIIKRMQENHGHWHWNTKNATGFVNYAIKCGKRIKKTGFAFYGFDWEAAR